MRCLHKTILLQNKGTDLNIVINIKPLIKKKNISEQIVS